MSYENILYEELGPVAVITYNRPEKRNAWNVAIVRETMDAFRRANAAESVRSIVLTGAGTVYCAGADRKSPPEYDANGRRMSAASITMGKGELNWIDLLEKSKPNVIAVNGASIGIGCTHILSADIRIAAASATFQFPFLKLGAMPELGGTGLLARLVGFGRAVDICLRSRTIDAEEALRIGLVTSVHPDGELKSAAIALAEQLASYPPLQVKLTKSMLYENVAEKLSEEILGRENRAFLEMFKALKRDKAL